MTELKALMNQAREVEQRMQTIGLLMGLTFPVRVRFQTALEFIEEGLASRDRLEVAVGYLMLRDLVDEFREEQASEN